MHTKILTLTMHAAFSQFCVYYHFWFVHLNTNLVFDLILFCRIRSDHNIDNSIDIVNTWLRSVNNTYHSIHAELIADKEVYAGETSPAHWTEERFSHMIKLRESALDYGRRLWADYVLVMLYMCNLCEVSYEDSLYAQETLLKVLFQYFGLFIIENVPFNFIVHSALISGEKKTRCTF